MKKDSYGQVIYTEDEVCDLFMVDPTRSVDEIFLEKKIEFHDDLELQVIPSLKQYVPGNLSVEEFDKLNQHQWFMPTEYCELDIAEWVLGQCNSDAELQRAGEELLRYQELEMFDLLRYMKYLVDAMRHHNVVWGVGRGSSVASFVLYLIGVHKINSLYYDLSIDEFLK